MRRFWKKSLACLCAATLITGCAGNGQATNGENTTNVTEVSMNVTNEADSKPKEFEGAVKIELSDEKILVDGQEISEDESAAVYVAKDIVFYLEGQDFTYGEGTKEDEHSKEEADKHMVVHISEPGTYSVSGTLSAGQIAVDLGEDAKENPEAVVTLIMNDADIACSVAPAVIFYNVYECGSADADTATKDVDTSAAGANIVIADGTVNNITGSYVARIYKSVELNEAGTEVVDSKKLHKYDAAFYSKMTMNVNGDDLGSGVLNINAENEGLDSELHLTINGGNINIVSGNDGINTNEDYVSVTTVNGGNLNIVVDGATGEGDGIDSNGWLVINGGTVVTSACSISGDAGIDSDMGIHINGGTVMATGNMLDRISESDANYAVFSFLSKQAGGLTYTLKNSDGEVVCEYTPENDFTYLIVSSDELVAGTYTLWTGDNQYAGTSGNGGFGGFGAGGMKTEGGMPRGEMPSGEMPEGMMPPSGEMPGGEIPEGMMPPTGEIPTGEIPEGDFGGRGNGSQMGGRGQMPGNMPENMPENVQGDARNSEASTEFNIVEGGNYFNQVGVAK